MKGATKWNYAEYLELITKEMHTARVTCAKMASGLGGVFIMGIQVYSRLV